MKGTDLLLEENRQKNAILEDPDYDPRTGKGAVGDRFDLWLSGISVLHLPVKMKDLDVCRAIKKHGSVLKAAVRNKKATEKVLEELSMFRMMYDFEFWAASCVKIQDKETKQMVPFRLRLAQQILLNVLEERRLAGQPIRVILLKARQPEIV